MRITIKTLQQKTFPIEITPEENMLSVKEKISQLEEANKVGVERQKLIHSGKVLDNSQLVSETGLKDGEFVVLMIVTPKPVSEPVAVAAVAPLVTQAAATTVVVEPVNAESKLVTGEAYEDAVGRLVDMGFVREEVIAAMRASFNNPERAVEYLTTGVLPEGEGDVPVEQEDEDEQMGDSTTTSANNNSGNLEFLRNDPQFHQLRTLIQQNPQMLGPIIEQLSQTSPELLQVIEQNKEEFYSMLMEGAHFDDIAAAAAAGMEDDGEGEGEGEEDDEDDEESSGGGAAQVLHITSEERVVIERMEGMGFNRARVVEAYFACDKNEELAVNYLLEHGNDQD